MATSEKVKKFTREHSNKISVAIIIMFFIFGFGFLRSGIQDTESDLKGKMDDLQDQVGRLQNQVGRLQTQFMWISHTNEAKRRDYNRTEILEGVGKANINFVYVDNNYIGYPIHFENKFASENLIRELWEDFKEAGGPQMVGKEPRMLVGDTQNIKLLYPRFEPISLENNIKQNLATFFEYLEYRLGS
ncbi:hypothetical protein AKJ66_02435 [candidate division MSBL1 archaeon SCGC-AAA259E22]|uniref:Uncharacterized protein n=1 Tax=candidate division MSBL1 archaeon SCGC-AAA259E22 TaxID=1698265 RepID=A0A133UGA5_9EURY|nr:hypothetical protein AKJ66_02435 [candidate division MSBL1 archaeon SCGC-AAA259E22]